ncbi:beta-1,3-galactosyltransferase 5-like [Actinia tenebrosa]|uniref:Hexosyltransferase n=1 Tax=Actinia tenebrosa TaxID=6105 RepID=A0A6P8J680_ACTTE|nr:beta-1,3-galactosyltransferase 5-like [Actinia tenebrosa]
MILTKKNAFYAAIVVQALILLYLIIPSDKNHPILDFTRSSLAWFLNNNEDTSIVLNTTHACISLKPTIKHKPGEIFLVVLVISKALNEDAREAIRNTWGSKKETANDLVSYVIFVTGCTPSIHLDHEVDREASKYNDILRLGSQEDKDPHDIKRIWHGYRWAIKYQPKFIIKTHYHLYVHLPRIVQWLKDAEKPDKLYAGKVHNHVAVNRNPKKPFVVSEKEFSPANFPDYCAGPFYAFSGKLLKDLLDLERKIPKFNVEDAYLGVLMKKLEIEPTDIDSKLHIEGQLGNDVQSWTNQMYINANVIGMDLQPSSIQYIHDRYKGIERAALKREGA